MTITCTFSYPTLENIVNKYMKKPARLLGGLGAMLLLFYLTPDSFIKSPTTESTRFVYANMIMAFLGGSYIGSHLLKMSRQD